MKDTISLANVGICVFCLFIELCHGDLKEQLHLCSFTRYFIKLSKYESL